jgi:expansin (peptidoglycan-binding protein)
MAIGREVAHVKDSHAGDSGAGNGQQASREGWKDNSHLAPAGPPRGVEGGSLVIPPIQTITETKTSALAGFQMASRSVFKDDATSTRQVKSPSGGVPVADAAPKADTAQKDAKFNALVNKHVDAA